MRSIIIIFLLFNLGCGTNDATNPVVDHSASGSLAATLGGAVYGSSASGTVALSGVGTSCPTPMTGATNCSTSGSVETLTYSSCSFSDSNATWIGSLILTLSTGSPTCGTFPVSGSYSGTLQRQFGSGTIQTGGDGTVVSIDTFGAVTSFTGNTYPNGTFVTFSSGSRTAITLSGVNAVAKGVFSYSITTNGSSSGLVFNESSQTVSGQALVFDNIVQVKGTSTVDATFSVGCCTPTSGSISTFFTSVNAFVPTVSGYVGNTEVLTFTGCGTATLAAVNGSLTAVTLDHCF